MSASRRLVALVAFLSLALVTCNLATEPSTPPPGATPSPVGSGLATAVPPATLTWPAPPPGSGVTLCRDPQPPWITDLELRETPELPEPAPRGPFRDSVFGTCLVRVTDRATDLPADDQSGGLKNEYSRVQSFNADGTRLIARSTGGSFYLYDAQTLQPLGYLPVEVEPRWDASDPNLLYFTADTRLLSYRLGSDAPEEIRNFAEDFPGMDLAAVWTRYEGSPSADTRYWGLMAENQDWLAVALLVYDRQEQQVAARREIGPAEIDSVTISPLGDYFLAHFDNYCEQGQLGTDANPCGLMVYDRDLRNGRGLLRIVGHSDVALDAAGREVLVYQDIDTDHIAMLDLASGQITNLQAIDFSHTSIGLHFSGRAFGRPGWVLVSTHDADPGAYTWMDDQVFALELVPGGQVVRLAHTHSLVDASQEQDYWAEPHASVNQDFTRVLFTSNWGRAGTEEVDMYMLELPAGWPGGTTGGPPPTVAPAPPPPGASPTPIPPPTAPSGGGTGALNPNPPGDPMRLVFIHHSTGENWLADGYGDLGRTLDQTNYFVSDTNYGWGPDAIGDRTDIPNWTEWFRGPETDRYTAALFAENGQNSSYARNLADPGGENRIVLFKSCFPNSQLEGSPDDPPAPEEGALTVSNAKYVYNEILQYFATRPDKLFVVITAPPVSDPTYAANARAFNQWLMYDWLRENHYTQHNVAVFDFYNVLTGAGNHHRYRNGAVEHITDRGGNTAAYPSEDDHPSPAGSQKATDEFVPLLNAFVHCWLGEGGCP